MTMNDVNVNNAELVTRVRELEESAAHKDAQIARLAHDLAAAKKETKLTVVRMSRQLGELDAIKNEKITELVYHLDRFNASPWWRLGQWLEKLVLVPLGALSKLIPRKAGAHRFISDISYRKWVELYDTISEPDRDKIRHSILGLDYRPLISIVMPAYDTPEKAFREAIESVRAQLYTNWELCVADDASPSPKLAAVLTEAAALDPRIKWIRREVNGHISEASNSALALASGEFIALLDHDDILPEHALYEIVVELNAYPDVDIIYSDEDRIGSDGVRHSPYFKTDWNPELFLAHNMISHLGVYRRSLIEKIGGFRQGYEGSQDYDLALRAVSATCADNIRHIPAILYHWCDGSKCTAFSESQFARCVAAARHAKRDYFAARNETAEVEENPFAPGWDRIRRPVPSPAPLVSLIVPTRNRADLLGPCIDGFLHRTEYQPIEILIIDHQSDDPKTLALLKQLSADERVRIVRYEGPFNYSDMNNKAVAEARGEIIGFINNDIDVIEPDWLSEMVALAVLPENGAVGAKLLYPNNHVQHAGVIVGSNFEHAHANAERSASGYFCRLVLTSNISAVTGACLVLRKRVFEEVGGFNSVDLPVAFNDVDLCLEIRARGYRNVWTPFALLYHHESVSRGSDAAPEKIERFNRELNYLRTKWGGYALEGDPYFNVNLSLQHPSVVLAFPPRRVKPWRMPSVRLARYPIVKDGAGPDCDESRRWRA
jgi:glycosyltransferase involved in cell wall biosynthesis